METHASQRVEAGAAVGLVAVALVLALVGAIDGSLDPFTIAALAALALGAVLALDAWRRAGERAAQLATDLAAARSDVARAAAERDAARQALGHAEHEAEQREAAGTAAHRELEALGQRAAHEIEEHRAEHERLRQALRRAEDAGKRQRELLRRLEHSRRAEREWNRELRLQLQGLYESPRRQPASGDVEDLILQAAIALVEAEKGMLLSREDADGDGSLDLAASRGFEHDPAASIVAQRFARQVLASDEIIREDAPTDDVDAPTPADEEIDALVAIPLYLHDRFSGVIVCANRPGGFEEIDDDVLLALGDQAGAVLHQSLLRNEVRDSHHGAVRALLEALTARDPDRQRDSVGLTRHAAALADALGFDEWQKDVLVCATLLREVGYLALPEELLAHEEPLRPDERAVIELHPRLGFDVIGQMPALRDVAATVLYHQERFDGRGYPAGLVGEQIPRLARALAVVEAYGAMTSERPYREARTPEEACAELIAEAGSQFDPEMTQLLVEHIRRDEASAHEQLTDAVAEAMPQDVFERAGHFTRPLTVTTTDGLTLLGNRRVLEQDLMSAAQQCKRGRRFAVALIQLEDLTRTNEEAGHQAGDRLIQLAARSAQRAAARWGGTAYRSSGRRLAVLAPLGTGDMAADLLLELASEFSMGPSVRTALRELQPGDQASDVLDRARESLCDPA